MAWINKFLLGRPGFEYSFDVNPSELSPTWSRIVSANYNLAGDRKERVIRSIRPIVKLKQSIFPKSQLDLFVSMLPITDTFLSFITRSADWNINLEPNIAPNLTTVQIQNSSITKLSAIYAAGGLTPGNNGAPYTSTSGTITVNGVWASVTASGGVVSGSGTNYFTGGTYLDSTNTITLGTSLPAVGQVYVSYSFPGWLVSMPTLDTPNIGGQVDNFAYAFSLEGI